VADVALDVRNISVVFGGLIAVNDFSMQVESKSIHALVGPNGAGKSTIFNCISRYYRPASGSIVLFGQDITGHKPHEMARLGVARTFQNLELFNELTVLENVMLGAYSHTVVHPRALLKAKPRELVEFAESLLERTGLAQYRDARANSLDFGHQKLLELARALAVRPKILLLDEPAAGLRNRDIEQLDRLLTELIKHDGLTVLLVEHVMRLVMSISDRITVLSFGQKIAEGTPGEIRSNPAVIEAYLGSEEPDRG
jgi:branched-chain amino acid transport system ATP-binding protein